MTLTFKANTTTGIEDSQLSAFTFPGGEAHIKGADDYDPNDVVYELADWRGADSHDLLTVMMWAEATANVARNVLLLPYLPYARADKGKPRAASVIAELIDSLALDQIITLDPHSPFMTDYFHDMATPLTIYPVERIIARELGNRGDHYSHPYVGVIAPDAGAHDRAARAAKVLGVPMYQAGKTRNQETGELTGFTCEPVPEEGKLLVVDDICDGGGTFIGLAEAMSLSRDRLDLWVTHGIFSKGFKQLRQHFGMIHTTDSYPSPYFEHYNVGEAFLTIHSVTPYLMGEINV